MIEKRIFLSPPHLSGRELHFLNEAIESNWIAPGGAQTEAFEQEIVARTGCRYAVAVSSGTAALHLTLRALNLSPGDEIICPTLTFIASASPILYEKCVPVFIDSESQSWNLDPALLAEELGARARKGRLPRAVIAVDLYGQCADYEPVIALCQQYEIPLIEDSAEALGATYKGRSAGTMGWAGVFSFNGNKIITTSGGGMLVTDDEKLAAQALKLSQQAREPFPWYEHQEAGFNYRMSNLLAGVGRAQLEVLDERILARRRNYEFYKSALCHRTGLMMAPQADWGLSNYWLSCLLIDSAVFGATPEAVRKHLEAHNIESRPVWKPLHLQPVFRECRVAGGLLAESVFEKGLCLPSGSSLTQADVERIVSVILSTPRSSF
jgi:dTDP-4-amino-4,6-dideoxygalactose transaminase